MKSNKRRLAVINYVTGIQRKVTDPAHITLIVLGKLTTFLNTVWTYLFYYAFQNCIGIDWFQFAHVLEEAEQVVGL